MTSQNQLSDQRKKVLDVRVRGMRDSDLREVMDIEQPTFKSPWLEQDFINYRDQRNAIRVVAEHKNRVVGYVVFEQYSNRIDLLSIAVAEDVRRRGVGSKLIKRVIKKLSRFRRTRILLTVLGTSLPAQLFFRDNGFRATSVLWGLVKETGEDAYAMQYTLSSASKFVLTNRISRYVG
jgi:[ribosomal protein S18]-alanine N-acetyltransferase